MTPLRSTPSPFDVGCPPGKASMLDVGSSPLASSLGPDRIVQLSTSQPGLRCGLHVEVRSPSDAAIENQKSKIENSLDFISSDATLDRYSEIISPAGWKLDTYRRNPVFQNSHQYGDILFTLGKALITEVRSLPPSTLNPQPSTVLYQRIQFAVEANPVARIAYALYSGKFLNAVSVGFIPIRWETGAADSGFTRKYLEQELLEVSAVGIPANPNALALAYKSGAVQKSDLQDTIEILTAVSRGQPSAKPNPQSEFLSLVHQFRDLLRS